MQFQSQLNKMEAQTFDSQESAKNVSALIENHSVILMCHWMEAFTQVKFTITQSRQNEIGNN